MPQWGANLELWLTRFELYVKELGIAENQWQLLEDEAFRVVTQLGLACSKGLQQQFATEGNKLEWQYQLRSRMQKPGEKFAEYAGHLHVLADKAYPKYSPEVTGSTAKPLHSGYSFIYCTTPPDAGDAVPVGRSTPACCIEAIH